jgi:hypothetical protein
VDRPPGRIGIRCLAPYWLKESPHPGRDDSGHFGGRPPAEAVLAGASALTPGVFLPRTVVATPAARASARGG